MSLAARLNDLIAVIGYDHKDHEQRIAAKEVQLPRVLLSRSSTLALSNATETLVTFDAETADNWNFHNQITNPARITCPTGQTGLYLMSFECWYASNNLNARYTRVYRKSAAGGILEVISEIRNGSAGGVGTIVRLTAPVYMNAGEYLECTMYQNAGAGVTLTTPASTIFFSLDRIS